MAYYYKISDDETVTTPSLNGIKVYEENPVVCNGPSIKYDFSKHVLIELLDNTTPEAKLWTELGLTNSKSITHKRMCVDPHRVNCRRAIVVCSSSDKASNLAQRLSQARIMKRTVCAVVIQALLSDVCLFEKQIIQYGDRRSQHQLVFVTDLARRRESSGLAQYLREKFSPFGTILSVLVSEDKDGYAQPEGVIKFAHLSEAFAAELAYDQCAVALERLSVTTHHNVLLSQLDLRSRLRQAYSRQSSEFSFNVVSREPQINNNLSKETNLDETNIIPNSSSKYYVKEFVKNESGSTINGNNEFLSDSAELADVLKKPCESNLVDCLQGIATFSESSISRRDSSIQSFAETEPANTNQFETSLNSNTSFPAPLNNTWSSRIVGWITDLSHIESFGQVDTTTNITVPENGVLKVESTILTNKDENLECDQQSKHMNMADVVSNSGSFITCNNGDLSSSFQSVLSSPGHVNDVTLVEEQTLSHSSESHHSEISDDEFSNVNGSSMRESNEIKSNSSHVSVIKRKNSSIMTQKLSAKSKRKYSHEVLDSETTMHFPSVPETKTCSVVLNSVPELNEIAKNLSLDKIPVALLERLSVSGSEGLKNNSVSVSEGLKNNGTKTINITENPTNKKLKKGNGSVSSSVKSQSVRRSSRLTIRDSDKRSSSVSIENGTETLVSSANFVNQEKQVSEETESILRVWLRKELDMSTSTLSQMNGNKKSTDSLIYATTHQDVLLSIGCSHMTCDFCYPDSTKLLLGYH